jgi:hypothetical protein
MRLLHFDKHGELELTKDLADKIPPYAILSHTWGGDEEEVTFNDINTGAGKSKAGYTKLEFCGRQAQKDGLKHFWVDTCCINKANHTELDEAIGSMFRWYRNAVKCYVYLSDVSVYNTSQEITRQIWEAAFRQSRWFKRAWTLQELLAPASVIFFSREEIILGDKQTLEELVKEITNIEITALRGAPLSTFTIDERLRWTKGRETKRVEDQAYCLLGIFEVSIPLMYGEGWNAYQRLKDEITRANNRRLWPYVGDPATRHAQDFRADCEYCQRGEALFSIEPGKRLPLTHSSFVLLNIEPGTLGDRLEGHMHESDLSEPPPYYALSYVWGQEPRVQTIWINDKRAYVQPNLFHALQRIRNSEGLVRVWVDALCINQADNSERSAQVQNMADIYGKGRGVMIWLGEGDSTSDAAIEMLLKICSNKFTWSNEWWESYDMRALSRLLERPWFERGWVLQEAACATEAIMLCGDKKILLRQFAQALHLVQRKLGAILTVISQSRVSAKNTILEDFQNLPAVKFLRFVERTATRSIHTENARAGLSLESLVEYTTFCETTDPRDAIYALLNLADNPTSLSKAPSAIALVPDYKKRPLDVFADFIQYCCLFAASLDIICRPWAPVSPQSSLNTGQDKNLDNRSLRTYPSWITTRDKLPFGHPSKRFTQRLNATQLVGQYQNGVFNAHGGTKPHISIGRGANQICDGSLRATGFILGEVVEKSTRFGAGIIGKEGLRILGGVRRNPHTGLVDVPDTIWRTLCANQDGLGNPAPLAYQTAMCNLLQSNHRTSGSSLGNDLLDLVSEIDVEELLHTNLPDLVRQFLTAVRPVVWDRRAFKSTSNCDSAQSMIGLAPRATDIGDHICILYGCSVPVVLRKVTECTDNAWWELIGEAYVCGAMDGEMVRSAEPEELRIREHDFVIR